MNRKTLCLLAAVALAGVGLAQNPVVTRTIPEVASVGDLVIIEGTNLAGVTEARFTADQGGFTGPFTLPSPVVVLSSTRITTTVPSFGFAPPNATPPGNPLGSVGVRQGSTDSNTVPFVYLQATLQSPGMEIETIGQGTTQSSGLGRAVVSFDIPGGPPLPGNPNFTIKLGNATPFFGAHLLVGLAEPAVPFPVGDGFIVVELFNPPVFVTDQLVVDANGEILFPAPLPAGGPFGLTIVLQWAVRDVLLPVPLAMSNGVKFGF